jgi:hypothetical protein
MTRVASNLPAFAFSPLAFGFFVLFQFARKHFSEVAAVTSSSAPVPIERNDMPA